MLLVGGKLQYKCVMQGSLFENILEYSKCLQNHQKYLNEFRIYVEEEELG